MAVYPAVELIPIGFLVGTFGTLIGAGGGFALVPILLLLYPAEGPEVITSISLAVVSVNALSGSLAYARMGRIHYRSGLLFSVATVPGAILGALTTGLLPRPIFDAVLGLAMVAGGIYLLSRPEPEATPRRPAPAAPIAAGGTPGGPAVHDLTYDTTTGVVTSLFVGYLSSLLGIGGGILHVPILVRLLNFPVHVATATSHFVLAIMALVGTAVHVATGTFAHGSRRAGWLAVGVVAGAQLGAWLSNRIQARWILRGLALALTFVGVRILLP